MIDFQNIFSENSSHGWACEGYTQAISNADKAFQALKNSGWQLYPVRTAYVPPLYIKEPWEEYFNVHSNVPTNQNHESYSLSKELVIPGEQMVSSSKFGKWDAVKQVYYLLSIPLPQTVFVCGVSTDCCVLSTVLGAVDDSKTVYVIEDACAAETLASHYKGIDVLRNFSPNVKLVHSFDQFRKV